MDPDPSYNFGSVKVIRMVPDPQNPDHQEAKSAKRKIFWSRAIQVPHTGYGEKLDTQKEIREQDLKR